MIGFMARADQADSEHIDLEPARQREILQMDEDLNRMNHFEVLGLPPGASPAEVKQAYYDASLKYHPDRFFQKNLGSFAPRIERIFKRLTEASIALSDPKKRREYERRHPELFRVPKPPPPQPDVYHPPDTVRATERRARLAKHPYLARAPRAGELMSRARKLRSEGEYEEAIRDLQAAARSAPQDEELRLMLEETRNRQRHERSAQELKRGETAEARGDLGVAAGCYCAAAELDKRSPTAAAKAARLLKALGKDLKLALDLAERAVALQPFSIDYRCLLGEMLADSGMRKEAKVQFEEAAKISPEHPKVKSGLKKARWLF